MSPDGTKALFICDWNLWVRDVATGQERQLTTDGVKDFGYATSNAGWATSPRSGRVVVAGQQEDRDAAAGRAQGRRHVPGRNAGQRRPPGAARLEVSAARRSGRCDDQPCRHRSRHRKDHKAALGARLSPGDVGRQHRHGRIPVEPGRFEARLRVDRSLSQELDRQGRRHHQRRGEHALHGNRKDARADACAMADPLGHERIALVLAARRYRAVVSLRPEDQAAEEQDHERRRSDHAHRQARRGNTDAVVRGRRQGARSGSLLHTPLPGRARRQEERVADTRQRHALGADFPRRQVHRRHVLATRRRAGDGAA